MNSLKRETKSSNPIKILQFGGGNFLRAYADWMIDILNENTKFNGDVLLIKPTQNGTYNSLRQQDGLYHILIKGIKTGQEFSETHLIKCIQKIINPYVEWETYLNSAKIPSIRFIISNTTESGIKFNPKDSPEDKPPREFPAKLTQWLFTRFQFFNGDPDKGCLFLPCELIENNGSILKDCILQNAIHLNLHSSFKNWINDSCHFSNTLVDRIVTGFPKENQQEVFDKINYQDKLAVEAEPYHLLVIEGSSIFQEELPFHNTNLNVVFTDNLKPFREIKVRILNGVHTSMVPVAYLAGLRTVQEAIDDPKIGMYIKNLISENIIPTLDFPRDQLDKYSDDILDRFKNPFIKHQLIDISLNSISKFKTRLLPSLLEYKNRTGKLPVYIIKALASLIIFYRGSYNSELIPLRDNIDIIEFFNAQWKNVGKQNENENVTKMVDSILKNESLWGMDLSSIVDLNNQLTTEVLSLLERQHVS